MDKKYHNKSSVVVSVLFANFCENIFKITLAESPISNVQPLLVVFKLLVNFRGIEATKRNQIHEVAIEISNQLSARQ